MKTKELIIYLLLFLGTTPAMGQEIAVTSFAELPQDLAARTQEKQDANGNACALVKVVLPLKDATFEGWVVEQQYTPGEYWVYMPEGATKVTVKHAEMPPTVYEFPDKLVGKTTYKLTLEVHENQKHYAFFKVKSNVKDCLLYIAGEQYEVKKGKVEVKLPSGTYDYVIKDKDDYYHPVSGTIDITDKDVYKTLNCQMEQTEEYKEYLAEKKEKKEKRKQFWNGLLNAATTTNNNTYSRPSYNTSTSYRTPTGTYNSPARTQTRTSYAPVQTQTRTTNNSVQTRTNYTPAQVQTRTTNSSTKNQTRTSGTPPRTQSRTTTGAPRVYRR